MNVPPRTQRLSPSSPEVWLAGLGAFFLVGCSEDEPDVESHEGTDPPSEWIRQFGASAADIARAAAVDKEGNVFVAGSTSGAFPGQTSAGYSDAFVRAYSSIGSPLWTSQFGSSLDDGALALAVGLDGSIFVAGRTRDVLPEQTKAHGVHEDAFVRAYAPDGTVLWTEQFGSTIGPNELGTEDAANAIAVDQDGNVIVAGSFGPSAFVRAYSAHGAILWTRSVGSSGERAGAVSVGPNGNIFVAGDIPSTSTQPIGAGGLDAFLGAYASDGTVLWTSQFGSSRDDSVRSVVVDHGGNIIIAGSTGGALPEETSSGGSDAFIRVYAPDGTVLWTSQLGSSDADQAHALAIDPVGNILLAGSARLPGENAGGVDAFVRAYATDGSVLWTRQVGGTNSDGSDGYEEALDVDVGRDGSIFLAGISYGSLPGQNNATGEIPAFVMRLLPPATP